MGAPLDLDEPFTTDAGVAGAGRVVRRPRRHPVLVGARRPHRLADRARHAGHDRRARPVRDVAVQAVQAAGRHRRRRPRRGPAARLPAALHDQHRRAQRGRHGHVAQPRRHAVERPGLPARLLRQPVPRLAGDARRGRRGVHDAARATSRARATAGSTPTSTGRAPAPCPARRSRAPAAIHLYAPRVRGARPGRRSRRSTTCPSPTPTSPPSGSTRSARSAAGRSAAAATATWRCGRGGRRRGGPTTPPSRSRTG